LTAAFAALVFVWVARRRELLIWRRSFSSSFLGLRVGLVEDLPRFGG
jgi:hypothetical protein